MLENENAQDTFSFALEYFQECLHFSSSLWLKWFDFFFKLRDSSDLHEIHDSLVGQTYFHSVTLLCS